MSPRLLFYVQHLLGVGHIKRASLLVQAWVDSGFEVTVVSGGEPVDGFDFDGTKLVQLPPVKAADAAFSGLVDGQGQPLDAAFKQRRCSLLLNTLEQLQPQLLVIENYPFGRRQLRWELIPLLQQAAQQNPRPLTLCSIRDIVQQRKPERVAETLDLLERYFDAVMVHGEQQFISLGQSFDRAAEIESITHYCGYVCEVSKTLPKPASEPTSVLVSAGGGAVGFELLRCCLRLLAQPELLAQTGLGAEPAHSWRLLMGPNLSQQQRKELKRLAQRADPSISVRLESNRPDFPQLLQHCRLSISQGGYNTLMDLAASSCSALVIPFEGEGETEQWMRCERLAQMGFCAVLREAHLSPANLAVAIHQALQRSRPATFALARDGAYQSAKLMRRLWSQAGLTQGDV